MKIICLFFLLIGCTEQKPIPVDHSTEDLSAAIQSLNDTITKNIIMNDTNR